METMRGVPQNGVSMKFWALRKRAGKVDNKTQCERLKCGHMFHLNCISKWFLQCENDASANCPMCRSKIKFSNKFGILNRKMYIKKEWIQHTQMFDQVFSNRDGDDFYDEDPEDSSDEESQSGESHPNSDLESVDGDSGEDWETDSDCSDCESDDEDWESDSDDSDWESESDEEEDDFPVRGRNYSQNAQRRLAILYENMDGYEYYDMSYNKFVTVFSPTIFELFKSKQVMDGFYNTEPVRSKKGFQNSKQGQDFGCAKV
uniref:RING-type domain-containing protein n=1 Tax=viral metagenome TaxID=1070528 RepID=A0A6C0JEG6_9ZZZZ